MRCSGRRRGVLLAGIVAASAIAPALAQNMGDYARVVELDEGKHVQLQIATHSLRKADGSGPVVHLVGAIHVGDKAYYDSIQKFLDAQDLVLYEGVKPALHDEVADADQGYRVKVTQARQRFLARVIARDKARKGGLPESIDAMLARMKGTTARLAASSRNDAWGRPIAYERRPDGTFELVSLGDDGLPGGDGAAADLLFSKQKPLTDSEIESVGQGIQLKLAQALGLEFQGVAIDYDRQKWRNSDMTVDEVQARLKAEGASADMLFSMLEGKSLSARVVSLLLGFIQNAPQMQLMVKVMLMEATSRADDAMGAAGPQMANLNKMMKVIVSDRNRVVLDDLRKVIDAEPAVTSVAIFYGAGHLPEMEKSLADDFGMVKLDADAGVRWFTAMDIDASAVPGGVQQVKQARQMMKNMTAGRGPKPETTPGLPDATK